MGRDQNIIDQHIYRIIYNMLMELEVYFKANGRNYEALKGRQPDFKDMFERFPKSKPKLMIGPDNWLRAWGSEKIKTITRINGVYVTFEWRSDLGYFVEPLTDTKVEDMVEISLMKKLRHVFVGTPKPKSKYRTTYGGKLPHGDCDGVSDIADDGYIGLGEGGHAYHGDKIYHSEPPHTDMVSDVTDAVGTTPTDVRTAIDNIVKDMQEVGLISKDPIKPSDGSDQPVAPQPMQVPAQHLHLNFGRLVGRNIWVASYGTHVLSYNMTDGILSAPCAFDNRYTINNVPVKFKRTQDILKVSVEIPSESESMLLGNAYAPPFYNEDVVYKGKTDSQGNTPAITQLVVSQPEKLEDAEKDMDALIEKDDSFASFTGVPVMPDVVHEKLKEVEKELGIQIPRDTVMAVTTATVKGDEVAVTDQKVYSPEPEIRHIPLKEPPEIRWDSMTNGYLTGTLTVFGTALSIKMEPNFANGYETICVDTKPNDNDPSLKETEPSKAISDLTGYQLAIEGCILPGLAADVGTYPETAMHHLKTKITVEMADSIRLRLGGRTRAELDRIYQYREAGNWVEWQKAMNETKRTKPASLET